MGLRARHKLAEAPYLPTSRHPSVGYVLPRCVVLARALVVRPVACNETGGLSDSGNDSFSEKLYCASDCCSSRCHISTTACIARPPRVVA